MSVVSFRYRSERASTPRVCSSNFAAFFSFCVSTAALRTSSRHARNLPIMFAIDSIIIVPNESMPSALRTLPMAPSTTLNEPDIDAAAFLPVGPIASISPLNFLTSAPARFVSAEKLMSTLFESAITAAVSMNGRVPHNVDHEREKRKKRNQECDFNCIANFPDGPVDLFSSAFIHAVIIPPPPFRCQVGRRASSGRRVRRRMQECRP